MSRSSSVRAAMFRALVVLVAFGATLVGLAGTSLATAVGDPVTDGTTASTSPDSLGISIGTLTWAVVGFGLLVFGFVAASRSGRPESAVSTGLVSTGLVATPNLRAAGPGLIQYASTEAQGQPASAVATV